jgi:hypothetical protein
MRYFLRSQRVKKLKFSFSPLLSNKDNMIKEMFSKEVSVDLKHCNYFDADSSDDSDY